MTKKFIILCGRYRFFFFLIVLPWFGHVFSNKGRFGHKRKLPGFFTSSVGLQSPPFPWLCPSLDIPQPHDMTPVPVFFPNLGVDSREEAPLTSSAGRSKKARTLNVGAIQNA